MRPLLHDRAQPRWRPRRADDRAGQRVCQPRGPPPERRRGGDGPADVDRRACDAPRPAVRPATTWSSSEPAASARSSCTLRRGTALRSRPSISTPDGWRWPPRSVPSEPCRRRATLPLEEQLRELTSSPTVVYECTGYPPAAQAAVATVERGGRVVVVGLHKNPVPVNLLSVSLDEKELVGTLAHVLGADLGHAVDLLEDGARAVGAGRAGRRAVGGRRQRRPATDDRGRGDADQAAPRPAHRQPPPLRSV